MQAQGLQEWPWGLPAAHSLPKGVLEPQPLSKQERSDLEVKVIPTARWAGAGTASRQEPGLRSVGTRSAESYTAGEESKALRPDGVSSSLSNPRDEYCASRCPGPAAAWEVRGCKARL